MDQDTWQWLTTAVVGLFAALLSWIGAKQVERIDALDRDKADTQMVNQRFQDILRLIDAQIQEERERQTSVAQRIDVTNERLAAATEKIGELVGEMRARSARGG